MPALAGPQAYTHSILHTTYGNIGTLADTIDRNSETTRIDSRLRIAVKFLGIVVSRQETDTIEIMHGDRLISLPSVSEKDGRHFGGARRASMQPVTAPSKALSPEAAQW